MIKRTILILSLISIVAMFAGTAMAPHAGRSIRLLESKFSPGTGAIFIFEYTGKFTRSDLKTAFALGNGIDPLKAHCIDKKELSQIRCTVSKVNQYNEVVINIIGLGFWASVPEPIGPCLGFLWRVGDSGPFEYTPWTAPHLPPDWTHEDAFADWEAHGAVFANKCVRDASLFTYW